MRAPLPFARSVIVGLVAASLLAACGGATAAKPSASPSGDPTKDKLAQVLARGTLVLYTDPAYPPQSMAVKGATRLANTKCAPNQITRPRSPAMTRRPASSWPPSWASSRASLRFRSMP